MPWKQNECLLRHGWPKYQEFHQIYTNGYLKFPRIAFYWPCVISKWSIAKYKPIYDTSISKILTVWQIHDDSHALSGYCRTRRTNHLIPVPKVISKLNNSDACRWWGEMERLFTRRLDCIRLSLFDVTNRQNAGMYIRFLEKSTGWFTNETQCVIC